MLSKFQKSQSAQKSRRLGANTAKTAQNKWEKGKTDSSIIVLIIPGFFILCLCKVMVLKHSLVSIPLRLPIPISSNHSTDLNINNKIRARVSINSIGDLKVSVRGNSNITSFLRNGMSIVIFMVKSEFTAPIPSRRISNAKAFTTISCPCFQERPAYLEQLS